MIKRNEKGKYVIGIDLGGTTVTAAVVDQQGNILSQEEIPSYAEKGVDITCDQIALAVLNSIEKAGLNRDEIIACGMGTPGIHKAEEGIALWSPNFNGWDGADIYTPLYQKTGFKFYMGNDVNVATFGEYTYGVGKDSEIMVMYTLGTGIGSGLIIKGKAYSGVFASPELGHTIIDVNGPRCGCGRYGCVEALCSRDAIINRAMTKIISGRKSKLTDMVKTLTDITPKMIDQAAKEKDIVACETMTEIGRFMGIAVANTINTFNPSLVVIGGGIASSDILFNTITQTAFEISIDCLKKYCEIKKSILGSKAGVLGGAALAQSGTYA